MVAGDLDTAMALRGGLRTASLSETLADRVGRRAGEVTDPQGPPGRAPPGSYALIAPRWGAKGAVRGCSAAGGTHGGLDGDGFAGERRGA